MTKIKSIGYRRQTATKCDLFFRFVCAAAGLQIGSEINRFRRYAVAAVWFVIHCVGVYVRLYFVRSEYRKADIKSFSYFIELSSSASYTAVVCFSLVRFMRVRDETNSLFQRGGRNFRELIVQLSCHVSYLLPNIQNMINASDAFTQLEVVYDILLDFSLMCFFVIFNDAVLSLRKFQSETLSLMEHCRVNRQKILDRRWEYRRRIREINSIYAWSLAVNYVGIFTSSVSAADGFISGTNKGFFSMLPLLGAVCFVIQLLDLARKGAMLQSQCFQIEKAFLENAAGVQGFHEMLPVLRFHQEWDALRIGCSTLRTEDFLNFVITNLTCTAVTLQFDFHIIGLILNHSRSDSAAEK